MLVEGILDEKGAEAYLEAVHSIDYSDIEPDPVSASCELRPGLSI